MTKIDEELFDKISTSIVNDANNSISNARKLYNELLNIKSRMDNLKEASVNDPKLLIKLVELVTKNKTIGDFLLLLNVLDYINDPEDIDVVNTLKETIEVKSKSLKIK